MSTPPRRPPGGGDGFDPDGFDVVAEQLRTLAEFFEDLEDVADGFAGHLREIDISGEQTGRCCPEAGDALHAGLAVLATDMDQFCSRALDVREALDGTARNYDYADATGEQQLRIAGAEL